MIQAPSFNLTLLHPRYWLIWLGLTVIYLLVLLPYPVIHAFGTIAGRFSMHFLKRRVNIARCNLALCFPDMPKAERDALVVKNFESTGLGLFETAMAWFWPDWRIKRWFSISGLEHVRQAQEHGQGVLLVGMHFLTLELGARIFGIHHPGIGVYRPHNNKLMDWIQTRGRLRSNKSMLDRKDLRGMIRCLRQGEIVWYAPDHDYGRQSSVFVPLFAVVEAATTTGTYFLVRMSKPAIIPFTPRRLSGARGYQMVLRAAVKNFPLNSEIAAATFMNKVIEKEILCAPEQYMWLHRRFKTRPEGAASFYGNS